MEQEVFKLSVRKLAKIAAMRYHDTQTKFPQYSFWIRSGRYTKPYEEAVKVVGKASNNNTLDYRDQPRAICERHTNQLRSRPAVTSSGNFFPCPGHGGEGDVHRGTELADLLTSELLSSSSYYLLLKAL